MNSPDTIRVLSVRDYFLLQEGIATVINDQADMRLIARASDGTEAIRLYRQEFPTARARDQRIETQ